MKYLSTINFIIWLSAFGLSFWHENAILDGIVVGCTMFFVIELIIAFKHSESLKVFLKEHYVDIILLIPIFKLGRFVKIAKVVKFKRVFRGLDVLGDSIEVITRLIRK